MSPDEILRHQAVNLLPACASFARGLTAEDFRVKGASGQDAMNIVGIITDVAVALSAEKYGRPRFRVPAGRGIVTGENASDPSPFTGNVTSERDSEAA